MGDDTHAPFSLGQQITNAVTTVINAIPVTVNGDFGSIAADIDAMEDVAAALSQEVEHGYTPCLSRVTTSMTTQLVGAPPDIFPELDAFMTAHHDAQLTTYSNAFNFRDGTGHFATAAKTVSDKYRGSDAFARASVNDVNKALDSASTTELAQ
jgi:hypothetical protein